SRSRRPRRAVPDGAGALPASRLSPATQHPDAAPGKGGQRGVTAGRTSWVEVPEGSDFPVQNLPYGVFARPGEAPRVGVAIGDQVLDLAGLAHAGLLAALGWFAAPSLNAFMAAGPAARPPAPRPLPALLTDPPRSALVEPHLEPQTAVDFRRPFDVADH